MPRGTGLQPVRNNFALPCAWAGNAYLRARLVSAWHGLAARLNRGRMRQRCGIAESRGWPRRLRSGLGFSRATSPCHAGPGGTPVRPTAGGGCAPRAASACHAGPGGTAVRPTAGGGCAPRAASACHAGPGGTAVRPTAGGGCAPRTANACHAGTGGTPVPPDNSRGRLCPIHSRGRLCYIRKPGPRGHDRDSARVIQYHATAAEALATLTPDAMATRVPTDPTRHAGPRR